MSDIRLSFKVCFFRSEICHNRAQRQVAHVRHGVLLILVTGLLDENFLGGTLNSFHTSTIDVLQLKHLTA